jgi:hypothetical protein
LLLALADKVANLHCLALSLCLVLGCTRFVAVALGGGFLVIATSIVVVSALLFLFALLYA